ncbi:MAG: FTR1 family protein [Anaerolineales bacterium]|nr:FTR1 family protein [Anaerolineales bacterium]
MKNVLRCLFALTLLFSLTSYQVRADALPPSQVAEQIRSSLFTAQMSFASDPSVTQMEFDRARSAYADEFQRAIVDADVKVDESIRAGFEQMQAAITNNSAADFALARAQTWTAILHGSYLVVEHAIQNNRPDLAQSWLPVREYRTATRFSRPNADATLALKNLAAQSINTEEALQFLHADLFDTYQARLNEALRDLESADQNDFPIRRAELAGLASGYFQILAPAYLKQRGVDSLDETQRIFSDLQSAAVSGAGIQPLLDSVRAALDGFRAAPLTPAEQSRRAGQLIRYLNLVPVEYERGVADGKVTKALEIQEAVTFHEAAQAAFDDLRDLLNQYDPAKTEQAAQLIEKMGEQLDSASTGGEVASADEITKGTEEAVSILQAAMPEEWQKGSAAGDFDVIASMLDQMENAVRQNDYALAESARLEAYAMMETGPEARLVVFAPQLKLTLEELFWNGQGEHKGLAYLIKENAPYSEIKATRAELDRSLTQAQKEIGKNTAPAAIAVNAGIIVFREGLEAVVILASLMSSLKSAEERKYRKPMWVGVGLALAATAFTWMLAHELLRSLARYGEKLEAVVSLVAIAILLLIMNWFFHNTYWTGWIANFHSQKRRLLSKETGLWVGLITLGFTSVYREGFEIVLFMQALVLEGGIVTVLLGVLASLAAVVLFGMIVFSLQKALPYMKILIVTGVLIGSVLLQMVGSTVHVFQVVGWLPIHVVQGMNVPYWMGTWFGVYPTWEGLAFQLASAIFVVGSYYLAEGLRHARLKNISNKSQVAHS